jgi:hypothetical protein
MSLRVTMRARRAVPCSSTGSSISDIRAAFEAKFRGGYGMVYGSLRVWIRLSNEFKRNSAAFFAKEIKIVRRPKKSVTKLG